MPLKGVRYRVKTTRTGKKVRLAFRGNKVVEAKNLSTGATHTEKEFKKDEQKRRNSKKTGGKKTGYKKARKAATKRKTSRKTGRHYK